MRRRKQKKGFFSKRNLLGIFIVAIMVLSGIGYMWTSSEDTSRYNGYRFTYFGNGWHTAINGQDAVFTFHPESAESLEVPAEVFEYLRSTKMVYIAFDPNSRQVQAFEDARLRLERDLPALFEIYPVAAVTQNSSQYPHLPLITCMNSTIFVPVIAFEAGNSTEIIAQESCIIMRSSDTYDVPLLTDRLVFGLSGIIQ